MEVCRNLYYFNKPKSYSKVLGDIGKEAMRGMLFINMQKQSANKMGSQNKVTSSNGSQIIDLMN